MTSEKKKLVIKLKPYHVLLLGLILSTLLILNSNFINNQRKKEQLYREKSKLFDKIISIRKLQNADTPNDVPEPATNPTRDESKNREDINKICKKGSPSLLEYYKTGDLSKIDLKEGKIECKEKDEDYLKALIEIVKSVTGEKEGKEGSSRNLKGFNFEEIQGDVITYAKHIIVIVAFLVIAILSIPGWLICCFCCCCNCCCCCCCKKTGCKIPCFIFTYIFYALAVVICIYGFSKTNPIFVGLADTECSVLKFFDEVLYGEIKEEKPRWPGIQEINNILDDFITQIDDLQSGTSEELRSKKNAINGQEKTDFLDKFTKIDKEFYRDYDNKIYISAYSSDPDYSFTFSDGTTINGHYVLDMINMLGRYNSESKKYEPENSFLEIWQREYDGITENADGFLQTAQDAFDTMVDQTSGDIKQPLNQGKGKINELRDSFDDIRAQIAEPIIQYSETIDKYGKLGSKLVFGVLALMNIALAIFILLLCFCSGKMCTNCCCCRCFFKFFIHLLWNILALLMIITFLVGFLFSLVGSVGYDAMSLISFVVSKDNLNSTNPVLVDKLGDAKKYLDKCINGDGKLEDVMDLNMGDINSFEKVNRVQGQINDAKITFENVTNNAFGYQMIESHLDERANMKFDYLALIKNSEQLSIDYKGVDIDNPDKQKYLIFQSYLEFLNTASNSQGKSESWERNNENGKSCGVGDQPTGENLIFDPLTCKPLDRDWISTSTNNDIKWSAQILTDTINFLKYAKDETKEKSLIKVFKDLRDNYYKPYLQKYSDALDAFGEMIDKIVGKLNEFTDQENGGVFGFINGKFIGTNLQIILKYLKSALGSDIKTIGICLLIVGCSLALSISATILLIVVINVDIDNNRQNSQVAEFGMASGGRVIQYQ